LGLALAACFVVAGACHGSDAYYREGDAGMTNAAGSVGGAAGTGGLDASGAAGSSGPCTTCRVDLLYTRRGEKDDMKQASFVVEVSNASNVEIQLSELTLRYWYTAEPGEEQWMDCDFAELGCSNVTSSGNKPPDPQPRFMPVMPPRPRANTYVEIGFSPGALTLAPSLGTGEIQLRLHNRSLNPIDQSDDYSFDDSEEATAVSWNRITAYLKGVLIWGLEPP
jgi:hypothetical protein